LFAHSTPKVRTGGCQRSCAPAQTWARIGPRLEEYGITRLANVTGLDRIGIPVWLAVRPNSRGLAVSQGKGVDAEAARVSAAMESIESWHAERPFHPVLLERYDELRRRAEVADPESLPLSQRSLFAANRRIPWIEAADIQTAEPVWTPFELVHTDATVPRAPGSGCFVFSTNGLASGNTLAEAVLHGICELVERDALALWKQRSASAQERTRVDLDIVDDPVCRTLIGRYQGADIVPMIWNVTSDIDAPVFRVLIHDRQSSPATPYPTSFGAGCHPDRAVALSRALTEAAQSRLTEISGSRDDGARALYRESQAIESVEYFRELASQRGTADYRAAPTWSGDTVEEDLRHMTSVLRARQLERVLMVDLSRPDSPCFVARAIVPGLEGPSSSPSYVPGRRARAVAA
jgi:ribosomal protein S12 methylthiotransferase accessory factor